VVSRALASLPQTMDWVMKNIEPGSKYALKNGLLYIKGGDFDEDLKKIHLKYAIYQISDFFEEEFFKTKKIVHVIR
jgi:16S rRNA (guanine527-N7)-methyltransferase